MKQVIKRVDFMRGDFGWLSAAAPTAR